MRYAVVRLNIQPCGVVWCRITRPGVVCGSGGGSSGHFCDDSSKTSHGKSHLLNILSGQRHHPLLDSLSHTHVTDAQNQQGKSSLSTPYMGGRQTID